MSTRVAICSMAAPWEQNVTIGMFNVHQANAMRGLGVTAEVFSPAMVYPGVLEVLSERAARANTRQAEYTYQGVKFHAVRTYFPHPLLLRWRVSPWAPGLAARSISVMAERRLSRLVEAFRPDAMLLHDAILLGEMGNRLAARLGIPFVVIEHDPIDMKPGSRLGRYYLRQVRDARAVFSVGQQWADYMRDTLGIKQARLLNNGTVVPTAEQWAAPRPERWRGQKVVLVVGGYIERKAHAELLRAWAEVKPPNSVLVIMREPPARIVALVAELGLRGHVEFLPSMTQQEVQQYMVWADLFALPSWWESFGLVYVEAMAAGTPVIMSSDCGMAAQIKPGVHGWVVPPRDHGALVGALRDALTKADLKAMGKAGQELVSGKFTWRQNVQQILEGMGVAIPGEVPQSRPAAAPEPA